MKGVEGERAAEMKRVEGERATEIKLAAAEIKRMEGERRLSEERLRAEVERYKYDLQLRHTQDFKPYQAAKEQAKKMRGGAGGPKCAGSEQLVRLLLFVRPSGSSPLFVCLLLCGLVRFEVLGMPQLQVIFIPLHLRPQTLLRQPSLALHTLHLWSR
ncbi:hypothetical protein NSK_008478 [Nannochloropsis salina CCMP1776]|jgi:hypothetical protein|uniref:Uncharacterized protein n=1 Tax=Nannochloropsis salina CCMP1776 TaxID=1027361 RepID=A0A4D9CM48_9STRA|nr:hypothetical protein NSK_008478 [Nannochloropsis salina CCMP1776]|eukprot:TFJ80192.1 hypothetical protein NSK_008478 [Nannochloropsis salina CCMP1776]